MGLIICLIKAYLNGLNINNSGTKIHSHNHAIISLGRWTSVKILHIVITNEIKMKNIPNQVKIFFLLKIHHNNVAMANDIETTAWSDGNELVGKISCSKVSSASMWFNVTIGLSL